MTDHEITALMGWPEQYMADERDPLSMVARVRAVVAAAEAGERERWLKAGEAAAKAMSLLTPSGICHDAHHAKADRHDIGEHCPVATRYIAAYHGLRGAIDAAMREGRA